MNVVRTSGKLARVLVPVGLALLGSGCIGIFPSPKRSASVPRGAEQAAEPVVRFEPDSARELITVTKPQPGAQVAFPLELEGEASPEWFWEGRAMVIVFDAGREILGSGLIEADMGDEASGADPPGAVPFTGRVEFRNPESPGSTGQVILRRANPLGSRKDDAAVRIPIRF